MEDTNKIVSILKNHTNSNQIMEIESNNESLNDINSSENDKTKKQTNLEMEIESEKPLFLEKDQLTNAQNQIRQIVVPPYRLKYLKSRWIEIVEPLVKHMKLHVRMNLKRKCVELKLSENAESPNNLQKAADFLKAFFLGFDIKDAIALLRLDDLFIESFQIKDVKSLKGDNFSRCIGRIIGKQGKIKNILENSTKTRIVISDSHVHILGAFENIKIARNAICALILGSPPGKVHNRLKNVAKYLKTK